MERSGPRVVSSFHHLLTVNFQEFNWEAFPHRDTDEILAEDMSMLSLEWGYRLCSLLINGAERIQLFTGWQSEDFKWPTGMLVSLAVRVFAVSESSSTNALTDADILTLRNESISSSPKSFFCYIDVRNLAEKKFASGAMIHEDGYDFPELRGWDC
ncbi:hypothetical protein BT96DRAFT_994181 [Gymnopus androsaceus JB14]|uniref:Uncharacterized protein n=1 Tax=Gymnopus androsaceus JB14 TaxID=1447944 RepID=A0A6A4HMB4_9AGAR|nr:hypothetical protein BT96DRAFT_994181 [Gymnopus androsaceus JB14]